MEPDGQEEWHVAPVHAAGADEQDPWPEPGTVRRAVFGRNSPRLTMAVALAAAVLGVVAALVLVRGPASSPGPVSGAAASPSAQNGGGGNGGLPPLSPQQGAGTLQVRVAGTVTAVSTASITIGGTGGSLTALFTAATKFSGQVTSPAGIKDGDQVAVVAAGPPSRLTVTSIKDPA